MRRDNFSRLNRDSALISTGLLVGYTVDKHRLQLRKKKTMPEPVLRSQDLYKSFGRRKVLQGVNFSIYPGTLVGIVGENGAGKSTLLRILAGELGPNHGDVYRYGTMGFLWK